MSSDPIPPPVAACPRQVTVDPSRAGERLDRVLAGALPDLSRARLQALIRAGQVAADGRTIADPSHRVKGGQTFAIFLPDPVPARPQAQAMDLMVVYEDEAVIVIDKPAGLVVHPAPGNPDRTLVNALLAHCGDSLAGIGGERRPGIVHRLDKDTSGLMVAAKTEPALNGLAEQFAARTIGRCYLAVVWGVPEPAAGEITGDIGRHPTRRKRMAVVTRNGKPALTRYRRDMVLADGAASLVACRLATGRTHQIRVHMAHIGHPLVGDPVYGRKRPRGPAGLVGFPRQALHAASLAFFHPATGAHLAFERPLPADMAALVANQQ